MARDRAAPGPAPYSTTSSTQKIDVAAIADQCEQETPKSIGSEPYFRAVAKR